MSESKPVHILLMEDDRGQARLFQKKLEGKGYVVDIAYNGEEGLAMYEAGSCDVLLIDQGMPVYTGLEVIRILASRGPLPPIVMVTGTGSEQIAVDAMKMGADDYVVKDVDGRYLELLPHLIERALRQHRLAGEKKKAEKELRESKERYRTVVEDMPAMICRFLPDGTLTFVNDAYCRYFNKKKEELIKQNFFQFIPEEDHEEVKNHFISLTMQEPVITYEHQVVATDGDIHWQQWTDRALFDLQDNLVGYQSIGQDITERKRAEEELEVHREHLKLINQILRHDILNDLTAVKSALRLYESSNDEEFLKEASRYVDRGAGTIKRMRELESIISSHRDLEFYDIKDVIRKVIENYGSIQFTIEGKCQVLANGAIDSVIDNIISNAVVHGKTDRIDITIDKQGNFCEVRIADHGIGIPDEMKLKIFEEDFKYGETGHTGLGLHIVKKAMENYGGSVYVKDNTPQGAVFVLRLRRLR